MKFILKRTLFALIVLMFVYFLKFYERLDLTMFLSQHSFQMAAVESNNEKILEREYPLISIRGFRLSIVLCFLI